MNLAILGGRPRFENQLCVGKPNIPNKLVLHKRLDEILERRWLSNDGKFVREFEDRVASESGAKHAVAFANATVGMEWLIRALDLRGEVIIPAFTFIATAHAVLNAGCIPVFADVDAESHLLSPESAISQITNKTSAICGVHLWGQPCANAILEQVTEKHGIHLFYDAAHAFGCSLAGRPIGELGGAAVFSFHATKFVNSFEGGAVVTSSDELASRLRLMRNFGFAGYDKVVGVGTNGKMDEFRAAAGLGAMEDKDSFVDKNRANWLSYKRMLSKIPGLDLLTYRESDKQNYQYVIAKVRAHCKLSRDEILKVLWSENVAARRYFYPGVHRMEPYCRDASSFGNLDGTEQASREVLVLPTGQEVDFETVKEIGSILEESIGRSEEVRLALAASGLPLHKTLEQHSSGI